MGIPRLGCPGLSVVVWGLCPERRANLGLLRWKADCHPLDHQGSSLLQSPRPGSSWHVCLEYSPSRRLCGWHAHPLQLSDLSQQDLLRHPTWQCNVSSLYPILFRQFFLFHTMSNIQYTLLRLLLTTRLRCLLPAGSASQAQALCRLLRSKCPGQWMGSVMHSINIWWVKAWSWFLIYCGPHDTHSTSAW